MRQVLFSLCISLSILAFATGAQAQCSITPAGDHLCGNGATATPPAAQPAAPSNPITNPTPPAQPDYSDPAAIVGATPATDDAIQQDTVTQPNPIAMGSTVPLVIPANGTTSIRFVPDGTSASFTIPPGAGPLKVWISSIAGYNSSLNNLNTSQDYFQNACYAMINDPEAPAQYVEDRVNIATPETIRAGTEEGIAIVADIVMGNIDLRTGATDTLQDLLGIRSAAVVSNTVSLGAYTDLQDLLTTEAASFVTGDSFSIIFTDPSLGALHTFPVTLDLSDINTLFPIDGITINDPMDQLVAAINAQTTSAGYAATARRDGSGNLVIESTSDITIDGTTGLNPVGAAGLAALGLTDDTTLASDPWIDITLVGGATQRVYLEPGDTDATFLAKINALPGLVAEMDTLTGFVTIHASDPLTSVEVAASDHQSDGTGTSGLAAGTSLLTALFGSEQPYETMGDTDPNAWWNNCAVQPGQTYYINIENLSGQPIDTTLTYEAQQGG